VPFTIYLTNGFPNRTAQLWWYMLEEIILENSKLTLRLPKKELNFNLRSQQEKEKAFDKIRNLIINQSDHNNSIIKNLEKEYNKKLKTYVYRESLTWEELQDFSKDSLLTVGFHTMNHLALNKLSEENLNSEVLDSKTEIECKIGKPICHFAYPYGTKNEINLREVSALKMMPEVSTSVTTRLGNIFTAHKNHLHSLPRIQVLGTEQNISILELYLSGVLPAIKNKFKRVLTI
jgi:peptidoglycan/xylan/chitin deacetylase (PgdA/CDA1 family)